MNLIRLHMTQTKSIPPPGRVNSGRANHALVIPKLLDRKRQSRSKPDQSPIPAAWVADGLRGRWDTYRNRLAECREQLSAGSVHQLRVATRRLASQIFLIRSILPSSRSQKISRLLKRQLQSLSPLRDVHVLRGFLERQTARFPELVLLQHRLERQERELVKPVCRRINRGKTSKLERWMVRLLEELDKLSNNLLAQHHSTAAALRCADEAFAEAARCRQLILFPDLRAIHRTRVAFKKFRYTVESLSPHTTGFTRKQLRRLAFYQRKMGNIQDLDVIQKAITGIAHDDKALGSLLKPFTQYLRRRQVRALRSFRKSADDLYRFWPPPWVSLPEEPSSGQFQA